MRGLPTIRAQSHSHKPNPLRIAAARVGQARYRVRVHTQGFHCTDESRKPHDTNQSLETLSGTSEHANAHSENGHFVEEPGENGHGHGHGHHGGIEAAEHQVAHRCGRALGFGVNMQAACCSRNVAMLQNLGIFACVMQGFHPHCCRAIEKGSFKFLESIAERLTSKQLMQKLGGKVGTILLTVTWSCWHHSILVPQAPCMLPCIVNQTSKSA